MKTIRDFFATIRAVFSALGRLWMGLALLSIGIPLCVGAYLAWQTFKTGQTFGETVSDNYEWTRRVFFRRYTHEPAPKKDDDSKPWTETDEKAVAEIAKDTQGEHEFDHIRDEVMNEVADIILRQQELGISIDVGFRKAFIWLPLDWKHNEHVHFTVRWTTGWIDRDLKTVRDGVPDDILKKARDVWKLKRGTKPDPTKCAIHIVRPDNHPLTDYTGEIPGRAAIGRMREDPVLKTKPYKTKFYCRNYKRQT